MHNLTAHELHQKFLKKELKAKEITEHFLHRIEKLDPQVGAFLSVEKERALKAAQELDDGKRAKGKLAGVPIAVKDLIHVKGMTTTCGSKFLSNYKAPFDATVSRLLEEEGAILIGKTNLDEFGMGSSNENSAYKTCKNPWNLNRTPGGSSGGSAAAVSARMSPLSLGTDTGGSIRLPASFTGIVGFKPTYGRVSRFGMVAYGSSLDQIGPMGNSVEDVALVMEVIGKHCDRDSTSLPGQLEPILNSFPANLKGKKIGVSWEFLKDLSEEPKKIFMDSLSKLKSLGAEIVDVDLSILKHSLSVYYIVACAEASTNLARFDGIRYGVRSERAKTLNEVYDFSKEEGFGPEVKRRILLGTYVLSKGYADAYYKKAQKVRALMVQQYREAFKQCDLIASPVSPFAAFELGAKKDPIQMYLEDIYTIGINLAGLPAISVPAALSKEGLPMGLQLIGPPLADSDVLKSAHAFETLSGQKNRLPEFANV